MARDPRVKQRLRKKRAIRLNTLLGKLCKLDVIQEQKLLYQMFNTPPTTTTEVIVPQQASPYELTFEMAQRQKKELTPEEVATNAAIAAKNEEIAKENALAGETSNG